MTEHMNNSELRSKLEAAEKRIAELERQLAQKDYFPLEHPEHKQVEAAREEAELRYRALFEQTHDAIFILDFAGQHLAVNQRASDLLGYSREELLGLSVNDISAEPAQSHQLLQRLLKGENLPHYERLFRKRDGSVIPVEINVELVRDAQGKPRHIQSVVRDITDRRRAEIELQHRNDDLGLINSINEVIVQGGNLEAVVQVLAKELKRIFSSEGSTIYLLSPDKRSLTMQQYFLPLEIARKIEHLIGSTIPVFQIPIQEGGHFHKVLQSRQGMITSNPKEIQNWIGEFVESSFLPDMARNTIRKRIPKIYKLLNIKSTIIVPLISNGKVIGLLDVSSSGMFADEDLKRVESIGAQLTAAIQRQQSMEKIQRSEEFLNSIQNALSASIAILDETGTIVRVNSAWRKFGELNGLRHPEACLGLNYLEICDSASGPYSEEASLVSRAIREVIIGQRKEAQIEYQGDSPEEPRWFLLRITRFEDGEKVWVVLAHENITERKQAEISLKRSEAILAQAAKMANLGAWEIVVHNTEDLNDNPVRWSEEVYRIFGFERAGAELINAVFFDRVHPDDLQKVQASMSQAIAEKNPYEVEHRIIRLDGVVRIVEERADFVFDEQGKLRLILGAIQDITERKQTEQTLRETSEQFRTLFEASPEAIMLVDPHGIWPILDCNPAACSMNGYPREELIGRSIDILTLTPGDAAGRQEYLESIRTAGILRYDDFHRHKDGSIFPIETSTSLITLGGQEIVLGIDRDITERRRAESALRESESRYRALFEDMPIAIWEEDLSELKKQLDCLTEKGVSDFGAYLESHPEALTEFERKIRILDVNNAALRMYAANSKEELLQEMDLNPTEAELEQARAILIGISEGKLSLTWEGPDATMAGEPIEISMAMSVSPGYEKDYSRVIITTVDITERKQAERALREAQQKAQNYLDIAGVMMLALDQQGNVTLINQKGCEILGYTYDEVIGKNWINTFLPEQSREDLLEVFQKLVSGDTQAPKYYENDVITKTGEQRTIAWHNTQVRDREGRIVNSLSSGEDITERKRAEAELRASEERFRQLADNIHEAFWITDAVTGEEIYASPAAEKIWGYSLDSLLHDPNLFMDSVLPEDRPAVQRGLETQKNGQNTEMEYRITRPDGTVRWIWDRAFPIFDDAGQVVRLAGVAADVTERKQAEDALHQSELKYRNLVETSHDLIWATDGEGRITYLNQASRQIYGCEPEELIGHSFFEVLAPEHYQLDLDEFQETIANQDKFVDVESIVRHRDGRRIILSANSLVLRDENRNVTGIVGTSRDITERKRAEEALRESEVRFAGVVNSAMDAVISVDAEQRIILFNPAAEQMFGCSAKEAIGQLVERFIPGRFRASHKEHINHFGQTGDTSRAMGHLGTLYGLRSDGTEFPIEASISHVEANGQHLYTVILRDITERKQVEEQLRKLSRAVEQSASSIVITNTKGHIEYVNPKFTATTGYSFEEALGQNPRILKSGATTPQVYADLWKAITSGEEWHGELLNKKKNGELYWESATISPILNEAGETTHFIAVKEDITERKHNEVETQRRADEFSALYETARDLGVQYNLPTLLNTVVERARALLRAPGGGIYLYDETRDDLEMVLAVGSSVPIGTRLQMGEGMAGRVAQTQQRLIVDDYHAWAGRSLKTEFESVPFQAVLEVPMLYGGKLIGVLVVHEHDKPERKYTEGEAHLLSLFAEYAASAVHAARLLQETRRRAEETAALLATSLALTSLDRESTLQTIGDCAQSLFAADGCRIFLMEQDNETLRCVLALLETPEAFSDLKIKLGQGVTGAVAASGKAEIVNEMQNDPRAVQIQGTPDEEEAMMFAPLKERDRTIGILSIRRVGTERPFQPSDLVLLEALASMAASAVSKAHLFEEAQRRLSELEALYENGLAVGRLLEPQAIGQRIIQTFAQYLSWHHVTIRLCKDQSDELELVAFHLPHLVDGTTVIEESRMKSHVSRVGQGISGWVVQTGAPVRTSNLSAHPHYVETYDGMQSGLYMPLKVGDHIIGVISVESEQRDAFSEQDERLLATLANQAATAFENARLYQATQQELWDRRVAEEALRQSEENYRRLALELEVRVYERTAEVQDLYDNAPCGYQSLDQDGRIIRINQTELNWLGYTREEVIGQALQDFVTDESRIIFMKSFPAFKQHGLLRDLELEMQRKDGSIFPALINATAVYDKDGQYLTSRSTLFDDTDRKHAMETLRLANSEMKRAMRMKDEFLANMSHELRTPLNAILGLSESLLEQTAGPLNEKQHKYLGTVNESGRHLLELINDILDLAKIESGQIKIDPVRVNIHTACETSLRMIKQLAQKKNQTVEVEIENEIGHVWADERRLKQMMVNLLSNAVKFTPEGGQLGLRARIDRREMNLLITIWDRGIGIREQDLKRLFRPFVQLDSSLSRESAGTGLGLALVAEMARLHGGSISVASQPGEGSQFTIILPWDPAIINDTIDKLKITGKIPIMRRSAADKPTILLVEDTESVVLMLRDYLELSGYQVVIATDGLEGVSKAVALQPDLILMDVQMPNMDGLEATRQMRKEASLKNTPIIALTALAMPSDREHCLAAGMSDYFSKPINLKELAKAIQRHLPDSGTGKTYEYDPHRR